MCDASSFGLEPEQRVELQKYKFCSHFEPCTLLVLLSLFASLKVFEKIPYIAVDKNLTPYMALENFTSLH
jgi:hypothetical protein